MVIGIQAENVGVLFWHLHSWEGLAWGMIETMVGLRGRISLLAKHICQVT
jgi:hypothetical protein